MRKKDLLFVQVIMKNTSSAECRHDNLRIYFVFIKINLELNIIVELQQFWCFFKVGCMIVFDYMDVDIGFFAFLRGVLANGGIFCGEQQLFSVVSRHSSKVSFSGILLGVLRRYLFCGSKIEIQCTNCFTVLESNRKIHSPRKLCIYLFLFKHCKN